MCEQPNLIWWTAIPAIKQSVLGARRLVSTPFESWQDLLTYNQNEVFFYGEDDADSGLIATKARITTLDGVLYVIFDNQFYRLSASTMIPRRKLKMTDAMPPAILFVITLKGINKSEDNLLIVTENTDPDSPSGDIPNREFYWLTRELIT